MKKIFYLISIVMILVTYSTPNIALAQQINDYQKEFDQSVNSVMSNTMYVDENTIEVSTSEKKILENKATSLLESGEVKPENFEDIGLYEATVQGIQYEDSIEYSVSFHSVKMNDEDIVESVDFFNIVFTEDKNFKSTFELSGNMDKNYVVTSELWIDGELFNSVEQDISEEINTYKHVSTEEVLSSFNEERESQGLSTVGENNDDQLITTASLGELWDCTQSCVASKGVNMLAFAAIVGLCGFACTAGVPVTAGTACYACVNTAGILGSQTVLNCLISCSGW